MKIFDTIAAVVLLSLFSSSLLLGQTSAEVLPDFKITFEKVEGQVIMKCESGCSWTRLTYENDKDAQAINQNGMIEIEGEELSQTDKEITFLFAITRTDNGLSLKGVQGTAWLNYAFSLAPGEQHRINQFGGLRG